MLATDQFAVRPWYVQRQGSRLLAATTMRGLLRMLPAQPEADATFMVTFLANARRPSGTTLVRGVERLPGAHAVVLADGRSTTHCWWKPVYRGTLRGPRSELVERLRAALGDAVRSRIAPDETAGVILSGGFDSSAVTGVAASESEVPGRLRTYSAVFPDDPSMDESARVLPLVAARSLPSHLLHVAPVGLVRLALEYQHCWGIPIGGPGYLLERPLLERAARDGVRGILDGQGGDELFGYSPYLLADRLSRGRLLAAVRLLASFPDHPGLPPRRVLKRLIREFGMRPLLPVGVERRLWLRGDPARHLPAWLRRDQVDVFLEADERWQWKEAGEGPLWWRWLAAVNANRDELAEYIGHRGRDLGLQMRPPLLDVDLVELALQMPPELGYGGINRSLARDSVTADVPDAVRNAARKEQPACVLSPDVERSGSRDIDPRAARGVPSARACSSVRRPCPGPRAARPSHSSWPARMGSLGISDLCAHDGRDRATHAGRSWLLRALYGSA